MKSLEGKTALITGGGTGIGRATAKRMVEEGARVWITGPDAAALEETCSEIGGGCEHRLCDVTSDADVGAALDALPVPDILISNAGVSFPTPSQPGGMEDWRRMLEVNLWGGIRVCLEAGRRMIDSGVQGHIILVSSILGRLAEPDSGAYGIAKAGLDQLTRQLARDWAPHGILVNAVAPGMIHTPMSYVLGSNECESDWFKRYFIHPERPRLPLLRPGRPEEVAEAILFFANPRNTYCTGQTLAVDGGLTIAF